MSFNSLHTVFLFIPLIFFSRCSVATPPNQSNIIQIDMKKDFGAKGNGINNDMQAFIAASKFIKQRGGNCSLNIPSGTYIIGKQIRTNSSFLSGLNALSIVGCKKVKIFGNGATLKFRNEMKFGSFNPNSGRAFHSKQAVFSNKKFLATCGNAIQISKSNEIEIINLNVDGNSLQAVKGGKFGDKGIQAQYTGINIEQSMRVTISDCHFHHLGLDGILISNRSETNRALSRNNYIKINNCKSTYNGRQGLSWVGGNGIEILNSKFTHTGHGQFSTSPGAGIDIEYEGHELKNGIIKNCIISNNKGVGIVSDRGKCHNILVKDCFIWGESNYSTWIRNRNFTFDGCTIYGTSVHGYATTNRTEATKFINCHFRDTLKSYGSYMVNNDGIKWISYTNCSFYPVRKRACYIASKVKSELDLPLMTGCKFYFKKSSLEANNDYWMVWRGVQFGNCTFYYDTSKKSLGRRYISSSRLVDKGRNRHVYDEKF